MFDVGDGVGGAVIAGVATGLAAGVARGAVDAPAPGASAPCPCPKIAFLIVSKIPIVLPFEIGRLRNGRRGWKFPPLTAGRPGDAFARPVALGKSRTRLTGEFCGKIEYSQDPP